MFTTSRLREFFPVNVGIEARRSVANVVQHGNLAAIAQIAPIRFKAEVIWIRMSIVQDDSCNRESAAIVLGG